MVKITCRTATQDDAPEILVLLSELHEELPLPKLEPGIALNFIRKVITDGYCAVAHTHDGDLAGSIGLSVDRWWFADSYYMSDYWTFVRKRYRRSRAAVTMFRHVKSFADKAEIPLLVGIFTRDQQKRKNALYRRHFDVMGEMFTYGLRRHEQKEEEAA